MAPALLCAPICTPVPVSQSVLCGYEESLPPRPAALVSTVSAYGETVSAYGETVMAPALLCAPICTPVPVSQSVLCGYEESLPPRPAALVSTVSAYGVAAGSCLTQSVDESIKLTSLRALRLPCCMMASASDTTPSQQHHTCHRAHTHCPRNKPLAVKPTQQAFTAPH